MDSLAEGNTQSHPHCMPALGYFLIQRRRHPEARHSPLPVPIVQLADSRQVSLQPCGERFRKNGLTILLTLAGPDHQAGASKIDVLDPQGKAFLQS